MLEVEKAKLAVSNMSGSIILPVRRAARSLSKVNDSDLPLVLEAIKMNIENPIEQPVKEEKSTKQRK